MFAWQHFGNCLACKPFRQGFPRKWTLTLTGCRLPDCPTPLPSRRIVQLPMSQSDSDLFATLSAPASAPVAATTVPPPPPPAAPPKPAQQDPFAALSAPRPQQQQQARAMPMGGPMGQMGTQKSNPMGGAMGAAPMNQMSCGGGMGCGGGIGGGMGGGMGGGIGAMGSGMGGGGGMGGNGMGVMAPSRGMGAPAAGGSFGGPSAKGLEGLDPLAMMAAPASQAQRGPKKVAATRQPADSWDSW
eukprot:6185064-Pleurochrysis_carterae.AAC.1